MHASGGLRAVVAVCFSLLWPGEEQQTRQPCAFPAGDSSQPSAFTGYSTSTEEHIQKEMITVAPFHLQKAHCLRAWIDAKMLVYSSRMP